MNETETTDTAAPLWRGWYRRSSRQRWRVVAEGSDERETHDAMLDAVQESGDFLLTAGTKDPNTEQRQIR